MGKRLLWLLDNLEEVLAGSFLISMIALMFTQVIYRYFFGKQSPRQKNWQDTLLCLLYIWLPA